MHSYCNYNPSNILIRRFLDVICLPYTFSSLFNWIYDIHGISTFLKLYHVHSICHWYIHRYSPAFILLTCIQFGELFKYYHPNNLGSIYVQKMQLPCPTVSEISQSMLFMIEMPVTHGMQTWLIVSSGPELGPTYPEVFVFSLWMIKYILFAKRTNEQLRVWASFLWEWRHQ